MPPHQNAAKRLKALLRRTHFPVARLKQIRVSSSGGAGGGGGGGGRGGVGNPWSSIVDGDPRAALIVLHWTLLDMSPLFSSNLLDRGHAGLQSLTDFKFVFKSLRILREEFDCRSQLTAEQFLTQGFAEVKMRLLADVVEIVINTHMYLARLQGDGGGHASSSGSGSSSIQGTKPIDGGNTGAWGARSDSDSGGSGGSGGSGASSPFPWTAPTPISQQSSRTGSVDSVGEWSAASLLSCSPFGGVDASWADGNAFLRHSPPPLNEGDPGQERMYLRAPFSSIHAPVQRDHHWYPDNSSSCYYYASDFGGDGGGDETGGEIGHAADGGSSSMWRRDPDCLKGLREAVFQSSERSPLGPRALHERTVPGHASTEESNPPEVAAVTATGLSPSIVGDHGYDRRQSDWNAVQQAFGSFGEVRVPFPSPEVVPTSPSDETGVLKLPPIAISLAIAPATTSPTSGIPAEDSVCRGDGKRDRTGSLAVTPLGRDRAGSNTFPEATELRSGVSESEAGLESKQHGRESSDLPMVEVLAKMQRQIEAMLEQHMGALEGKIKDMGLGLSARLTLLETKVHGLELGSPVRS